MSSFNKYLECLTPVLEQCLDGTPKYLKASQYYHDSDSEYDTDSDYSSDEYDDDDSSCEGDDHNHNHNTQQIETMVRNLTMSNILKGGGKPVQGIVVMRRGGGDEKPSVEWTDVDNNDDDDDNCTTKPIDALKSVLKSMGVSCESVPSSSLPNYFVKHTEEQISSYDMKINDAIRANDVPALKELRQAGRDLQVCNRFGESIVHIAARRGHVETLLYLMGPEANCSLRVCCDSGRTPLHDACWTDSPNFESIKVLLKECPDFFWISDNRNFTPLDYVPRGCWGAWGKFLEENQDLLRPKVF